MTSYAIFTLHRAESHNYMVLPVSTIEYTSNERAIMILADGGTLEYSPTFDNLTLTTEREFLEADSQAFYSSNTLEYSDEKGWWVPSI